MFRWDIRSRWIRAGLAIVLMVLAIVPALAGEVRAVVLSNGAAGTQAEIELRGAGTYSTLTLTQPDRLAIDFPDATLRSGMTLPDGAGVVRSVRTGQPVPGTVRIVFDLAESVAALPLRVERDGDVSRILVVWSASAMRTAYPSTLDSAVPTVSPTTSASTLAESAPPASGNAVDTVQGAAIDGASPLSPMDILTGGSTGSTAPVSSAEADAAIAALTGDTPSPSATVSADAPIPSVGVAPALPPPSQSQGNTGRPTGMRPLVVAIDAGHGGQDPGAIGPSGRKEKDVTLAIARELARQVDATTGLKAYLVRNSDMFIPLTERTRRARAAKADIFISIHADAAENRSATGSSVYVLSLKGASSQRARWLADKENAADLVGGVRLGQTENTLANVLLDLAQSGHMKASEDAANQVLGGLKRVGNNHKPNIERANFAVLRTADMPAMLVETAFISNVTEERRLGDPAFQRRLAGAVLDGVKTYFTQQPPPGTWFAARAQAEQASESGGGP